MVVGARLLVVGSSPIGRGSSNIAVSPGTIAGDRRPSGVRALLPTVATHHCRQRRPSGFSLIEILVVLVILAVATTAVTLAIAGAGGERQLARDSERLRALIGYACEQAERSGRQIGLSLSRSGYQFSASEHSDWLPVRDDELRARSWSVNAELRLARDGQRVDIGADYPDKPQLVCFSSGELTAFRLELGLADSTTRYQIDGAADGAVTETVADVHAP